MYTQTAGGVTDVSLVMINYNTFELTKAALESIFTYTADINYEIILIDNCSPDGSGERLRDLFKEKIKYIQYGENGGTSKAFNRGAKEARGKYILWLNTDILFTDNFIKTLFDYMENNPRCGICGGNLTDKEGNPVHSYRKDLPSLKSIKKDNSIIFKTFRRKFAKTLSEEYNYTGEPKEVGYITGADMMIRGEIVRSLGGFDEDIFMYAEETEFTYRAKRATNCTVVSVPQAKMIHLEGGSFSSERKKFNLRRFRASTKGMLIYFYKCYGITAAEKYLKILRRTYTRAGLFYKLCGKRERVSEYAQKKEVTEEFLKGIRDNQTEKKK